jgi:hypothetical protein
VPHFLRIIPFFEFIYILQLGGAGWRGGADAEVIQRLEGLVVLLTSEFSYGISDETKFESNYLKRIIPWESIR